MLRSRGVGRIRFTYHLHSITIPMNCETRSRGILFTKLLSMCVSLYVGPCVPDKERTINAVLQPRHHYRGPLPIRRILVSINVMVENKD